MPTLVPDLALRSAELFPENEAVSDRKVSVSYREIADQISQLASAFQRIGLQRPERLAIYLPKQIETVTTLFACNLVGGVFVPVNPVLKAGQVQHILRDCDVKILVTSKHRIAALEAVLGECPELRTVVVVEDEMTNPNISGIDFLTWNDLDLSDLTGSLPTVIDTDMAAILYTSGSTGKPKGVVLSHKNIVTGAKSVVEYLENRSSDRILAALPFSFDYGLNQLTSSLLCGACCVLMDYLLPRDVLKAIVKERITGLAAVPPLWIQLEKLEWPEDVNRYLRYMTNSGGKMPKSTLDAIRKFAPEAKFYLMYGLTEAFRSTYLPPALIDTKPDSMGKAIPNAEVVVINENGRLCGPNEPGELVHRGSLVAMGYWNDKEKTSERFRPSPVQIEGIPIPEVAVWSGDKVRMDEDGFLYFIGREDDMIKTSGYRVSPTEVEEVVYACGLVKEAAVLGITHPELGQAVVLALTPIAEDQEAEQDAIIAECKQKLPNFMVPAHIKVFESLPKNPNGKIDKKLLSQQLADLFQNSDS